MKKYIGIIILFVVFLFPISVSAEGIDKYYMDAEVNEDGSINVKELFSLTGEYNGFERIINYKNDDAKEFDKNSESYGGSQLNNGTGIILNKISGVDKDNLRFNSIYKVDENHFLSTTLSQAYDYGTYSEVTNNNGKTYKIYNKDFNNKAFYLDYKITDMAIMHDDYAELGWNIFSDELNESIKEFELLIHIPGNKNELRVWAHGPLNGNIKIVDKETVKVTINEISANRAFDVRLIFDKDVIRNSTKKSNVKALDKILIYENEMADKANSERNMAKLKYYGGIFLSVVWIIGFTLVILRTYFKFDKEYKSNFKHKYMRELPSEYGPHIVGYLLNKKVDKNELSASILNLIYKKIIKVEQVTNKKEDYIFYYQKKLEKKVNLTDSDNKLLDWLFEDRSKEKEAQISLSELKNKAKKDYTSFLNGYEAWKRKAIDEAVSQEFYEKNDSKKALPVIYSIIGIAIGVFVINISQSVIFGVIPIVLGIIGVLYIAIFTRRTVYGNDEFTKWNAFKNFLNDFGNFEQKELPEIALWEKYLVYAVVLDCAKKLSKVMELKMQEYPEYQTYYSSYPYNFYYYTSLNRAIDRQMHQAVNSAVSTKVAAESSASSGSGFGGGFSSGGGSFGGGGGGGRF